MGLVDLIAGGAGTAMDVWRIGRASDEAEFNRDWQSNMRATQYQTAVADMKAAGLNPMLAYMQGGAGNLSGAVADVSTVSNPVSSALDVKRQLAEIDLVNQQSSTARELARKTRTEADILQKEVPKAQILSDVWQNVGQAYSSAKGVGRYLKSVAETFPLVPQEKPYRQAVQPLTDLQREQLQRTGSYIRPVRNR